LKKSRSVATVVAGIALALTLTGCNPPMPPEVQAAIAEASYTCVATETTANFSSEFSDVAEELVSSLGLNCPDMLVATSLEDAPIQIGGTQTESLGSAFVDVPYAVDAGVFAITSSFGASAILTPSSIEGILNGSITSWDDPQIVEDNFGAAPLEGAITLVPQTSEAALAALKTWFKHYTSRDLPGGLSAASTVSVEDYQDLPEGSIAFMPNSVLSQLALVAVMPPMPANLATDTAVAPEGAMPDFNSIQAGASQWKVSKTETAVKVEFDFAKKPVPPLGFDEAPTPYQIVFPLDLRLYGEDNLGSRAVARYLLRQDSQGSFTSVAGLPVSVRAEALAFVSLGLPAPEPTDIPQQ
jgi:hypothetical protein